MVEDHVMTDQPVTVRPLLSFPVNELLALQITVAIMPLFEAEDIRISEMPEKIRRIVLDALRHQYQRIAEIGAPTIEDRPAHNPGYEEWMRQLDAWERSNPENCR
jgi:hypothetical protein